MVRSFSTRSSWTTDPLLLKGSGAQVLVVSQFFGSTGRGETLAPGAAGGRGWHVPSTVSGRSLKKCINH